MTDYGKYARNSGATVGQSHQERSTYPQSKPFHYWSTLDDIMLHVEAHEKDRQRDIITGVHIALWQVNPWMAQRFMERVQALPMAADTSDATTESLRFMQNDNQER